MFLEALATSPDGCKKVAASLLSGGGEKRRGAAAEWLAKAIAACGDIQDIKEVAFVTQKILGDLETIFIGLIGPTTAADLILGYGSSQGIDCLDLPEQEEMGNIERTIFYHDWLEKYIKDPQHQLLTTACGYEVVNNVLRSIWSGRMFSLLDTEHFLCKIWLAVIHSHACRNISEDKSVTAGHCYPLCEPGEWEADLQHHMVPLFNAFLNCKNAGEHSYPVLLLFESERREMLALAHDRN
jgi:hypothetical protein